MQGARTVPLFARTDRDRAISAFMKSIPALASLRALVIEDTKRFDVPWHILERNIAAGQPQQSRAATPGFAAARKDKSVVCHRGRCGQADCRFHGRERIMQVASSTPTTAAISSGSLTGAARSRRYSRRCCAAARSSDRLIADLMSREKQGLPAAIVSAAKLAG
jgi:hypothetical protein